MKSASRPTRTALALFVGVYLCTLAGCQRAGIEVHVSGLTPEITSLLVRSYLDGQPALGPPLLVQSRLDTFFVKLPEGHGGELTVNVGGQETGGCVIAEGRGSLETDRPGQMSMDIKLRPLDRKGCRVELSKAGGAIGTVFSAPSGISCGLDCQQAELSAPPGTLIKLTVVPDRASTFSGWSGPCQDVHSNICEFTMQGDVTRVTANLIPPRVCGQDTRLCWENPLPAGNQPARMWALSATDAWAVGRGGMIVHWNGSFWGGIPSGFTKTLQGIWGSSANDVWVGGDDGVLLHWDGTRFSPFVSGTTETIFSISGTGSNDVWAVGAKGTVLHYSNQVWTRIPVGTTVGLSGVLAIGSEVFIVGASGTILRRMGTTFTAVQSNAGSALFLGIWGSAPNDIWAVGAPGVVDHWDGSMWRPASIDNGLLLFSVWGSGSNDVWVGGYDGALLHFNGASWQSVQSGTKNEITAIAGTGAQDAWFLTAWGEFQHWNGRAWSKIDTGPRTNLYGVWGTDVNNVWAVGAQGSIIHWDGATWTADPTAPPSASILGGVWGSGPSNIWVVGGEGTILRWRGSGWVPYAKVSERALSAVWGSSRNDIWAVGDHVILHWDGSAWSQDPSPAAAHDFRNVWGSASNDVWACGASGSIVHWDGAVWAEVTSRTTQDLHGIWGSGPKDVWIGGSSGTVLHWDGTAFSSVPVPTGFQDLLWAVWGSAADNVYFVGIADLSDLSSRPAPVLHWDGSRLARVPLAVYLPLTGIWGSSREDLWVVGGTGAVLRYRR